MSNWVVASFWVHTLRTEYSTRFAQSQRRGSPQICKTAVESKFLTAFIAKTEKKKRVGVRT